MPIPEGTYDSVNAGNVKTIGDALQQVIIMGMQNAAAHQNRVNVLAESQLAAHGKNAAELDPEQAAAIRGVVGADLAKTVADLAAAVSSMQASIKGGQTVPPETGQS